MQETPNIRKLAEAAGVSASTVSRALNGKCRTDSAAYKRVRALVDQSGYVRKKQVSVNGNLLCVSGYDANNEYSHGHLLERELEECAFLKKRKLTTTHNTNPEAVLELIREYEIAGLILLTSPLPKRLLAIPAVILNEHCIESEYSSVDCDAVAGYMKVFRFLKAAGHERVAFFGHRHFAHSILHGSLERLYRQTGLDYDPELIQIQSFNYREHLPAIAETVDKLFSLAKPPTALAVHGDVYAPGCYDELRKRGLRIPEDIAVMGYDDFAMCKIVSPKLSSVSLPIRAMAEESIDTLLKQIQSPQTPNRRIFVEPTLVVRDSTPKQKGD